MYINVALVTLKVSLKRCWSYPSIVNIKTNCSVASHFNFVQALDNDIGKIIETIDSSKGSLSAVPPKLLKNNKDICQKCVSVLYNSSLVNEKYPPKLN